MIYLKKIVSQDLDRDPLLAQDIVKNFFKLQLAPSEDVLVTFQHRCDQQQFHSRIKRRADENRNEVRTYIKDLVAAYRPHIADILIFETTAEPNHYLFEIITPKDEKYAEYNQYLSDKNHYLLKNDTQKTSLLFEKIQNFLAQWPVERLKRLTLQEYHQANDTNCFISQVDAFDPTQGMPTFACFYDMWQPITLGEHERYYNQLPYSWHKRLGSDSDTAFQLLRSEILAIVEATQKQDLEAIHAIQFSQGLKWMIAFLYQDFEQPYLIPIVGATNIERIGYGAFAKLSLPEFLNKLLQDKADQAFIPYVESLFAMIRQGYLDLKAKKQSQKTVVDNNMNADAHALNRILFGAAGTGKTYHSINHALSILENKSLVDLEQQPRHELKALFDRYKEKGQIRFVTFHQSFSYEDFVEGIRAETDENENLTYPVKAGVFKEICDDASIDAISKQCDQLTPKATNIEYIIQDLIERAQKQQISFFTKRGSEIKVTGNEAGTLFALTSNDTNIHLSIRHIRNYLKDQSSGIVDQKSYEWAIAKELSLKLDYEQVDQQPQPYVLIIDEINRGNISRIFGELITLIEDTKRQGAEEALSVVLPYSKKEFSVPKNVYLIGTMNSSDRSLTGLDIALRRRFTFIEMPPKPELITDVTGKPLIIEGINIVELLKVINQRIEVLLDRDHCIGHANFMFLQKQPTLEHLGLIFKQKIIPQLQEYFFNDWGKINLVLFNNQMLIENPQINISNLFPKGSNQELGYFEQKKVWMLNDAAFHDVASYQAILGPSGS